MSLIVRGSTPEYLALLESVRAADVCAHTAAPLLGACEVDHAVELALLDIIAKHALVGATDAQVSEVAETLNVLVNARANLRALSHDAHQLKSTLGKRLRAKLAAALKSGRAITTMGALTAGGAPGMCARALRTVASDHRALAAAVDAVADGAVAPALHTVADVLRALVVDEFGALWSRTGSDVRVARKSQTKK